MSFFSNKRDSAFDQMNAALASHNDYLKTGEGKAEIAKADQANKEARIEKAKIDAVGQWFYEYPVLKQHAKDVVVQLKKASEDDFSNVEKSNISKTGVKIVKEAGLNFTLRGSYESLLKLVKNGLFLMNLDKSQRNNFYNIISLEAALSAPSSSHDENVVINFDAIARYCMSKINETDKTFKPINK